MMYTLPCELIREDLAAYHDGELSIDEQVAVQTHLQECVACRLEAAALAELSRALRTMAGAVPAHDPRDTGIITGAVLERVRVERQLSFAAKARSWFEDMHLVWAGLGATLAVIICVFASAGVMHAASQERPDSLAGIISTIANGAHDPIRLIGTAHDLDRLLATAEALQTVDHADLMLSAFVTRDGRIQSVSLLDERARKRQIDGDALVAVLEAASRARFSPAHTSAFPGGFSVVWLVTATTVKGLPDYDLYLLSPPQLTTPPEPPKPVKPAPAPSASTTTPTPGEDGVAA